jgi:hypothetical protein
MSGGGRQPPNDPNRSNVRTADTIRPVSKRPVTAAGLAVRGPTINSKLIDLVPRWTRSSAAPSILTIWLPATEPKLRRLCDLNRPPTKERNSP